MPLGRRRKPRPDTPRAVGSGVDPDVEQVVRAYLGRGGVAWQQWRSRPEIRAAVEITLGYLVAIEDVSRCVRVLQETGEADHRSVPLDDSGLVRQEWRMM